MPKTTLNLSVDEAAVERARRYVARHDTSISRFVNDLLSKLPLDEDEAELLDELGPVTRRLYGIARGGDGVDAYHQHLVDKYLA